MVGIYRVMTLYCTKGSLKPDRRIEETMTAGNIEDLIQA